MLHEVSARIRETPVLAAHSPSNEEYNYNVLNKDLKISVCILSEYEFASRELEIALRYTAMYTSSHGRPALV